MNTTTVTKATVTVRAKVYAPAKKVWDLFTGPQHIIRWNNASDDWHTTYAENDVQVGGRFLSRMEAKDGSSGFDFTGQYTAIDPYKKIEYDMDDGRHVTVSFASTGEETTITTTFETEDENPPEVQQEGWQAILNNFKKHVEGTNKKEVLHYEISINASVEKVYQTMFDEQSWREWTVEFNSGSHFRGAWAKGSKILFLGTDKDGELGGMVSRIRENIPNKFVSIQHLGIFQNNKEIMSGPDVDEWVGALENYTFTEKDGSTLLSVDVDTSQDFISYFNETWPKALNKLKEICERG